jgi:EmrB/QacA subfamily drug resistance transporter
MIGSTTGSRPPFERYLALLGVASASFLGCIDFTIVNTAIPAMSGELGMAVGQAQWVVTAFVIALSATMVASGRLADLYGRRRVLLAGMLLFGLGSLGAGTAHGMVQLIASRFLQGLACSALYTASAAIVSDCFPPQERGKALGWLFAANGVGLAIGPVAGGWLVAGLGWRSIFLLNLPIIAAGFLLCIFFVRESVGPERGESMDWKGLLAALLALPCALLAFANAGAWGWSSAPTIVAFAATGLLMAILFIVESRVASPLISFALLRKPALATAGLASGALAFFYCGAFFLMPLYLSQERGMGSREVGWLLLPTTAVMALASPLAGRLSDRFGACRVIGAGFALLMVSAGMQAQFGTHTAWPWVVLAFALFGLGWASILGPSTAMALAAVPASDAGSATGLTWTFHNFGGAIGLALVTATLQGFGGNGSVHFLAGYRAAMWMLAGMTGITLLTLLASRPRRSAAARAMKA